jgi:hypothetical protein
MSNINSIPTCAECERLRAELADEQETCHQSIMAGNDALQRVNEAEAELVRVSKLAGDYCGTSQEHVGSGCVDALVIYAEQLRERAERAEAALAQVQTFVRRERARRDAVGKGGQQCGDFPRITPSVLHELEHMIRNAPDVAAAYERMEAELLEACAVCSCGHPDSEHEDHGEDGLIHDCAHDCVRTSASVAASLERVRADLARVTQELTAVRSQWRQELVAADARTARAEAERDGMVAPEERDQWKREAERLAAEPRLTMADVEAAYRGGFAAGRQAGMDEETGHSVESADEAWADFQRKAATFPCSTGRTAPPGRTISMDVKIGDSIRFSTALLAQIHARQGQTSKVLRLVAVRVEADGTKILALDRGSPCDCGCERAAPGGRMEAAHPEDYRYEDR